MAFDTTSAPIPPFAPQDAPPLCSPLVHHQRAESWLADAEALLAGINVGEDRDHDEDWTPEADEMCLRAVEVMARVAQVHATLALRR